MIGYANGAPLVAEFPGMMSSDLVDLRSLIINLFQFWPSASFT